MGYKLPNWQRQAKWSDEQCSRFLESIWMGSWIGTFMVNRKELDRDVPKAQSRRSKPANQLRKTLMIVNTGKTRDIPYLIRDAMRDGRKFSSEQRLENALYPEVLEAELWLRSRRFLPQQAIKVALRKAIAESKRQGSCVLVNGTKVFVTHMTDAFSNARGFI